MTEFGRKIVERVSNKVFIANPVEMGCSFMRCRKNVLFYQKQTIFLNLAGKSWIELATLFLSETL
jgi:hypothetical protein